MEKGESFSFIYCLKSFLTSKEEEEEMGFHDKKKGTMRMEVGR